MLFFELLQVALGNRDELSRVPTRKEWINLYQQSEKQSILGIMLEGLERLPEEQRPSQDILLQWIGCVQIIEQDTIKNTKASEEAIIRRKLYFNHCFHYGCISGGCLKDC